MVSPFSGNLLKPSLDLILFTSQLSRSLGVHGTILLFLNLEELETEEGLDVFSKLSLAKYHNKMLTLP